MIYFDNNATTQVENEVAVAIMKELKEPASNPSSVHHLGQMARSRLAQARHVVSSFLKVKPSEIVFTSGGTESMNLLIQGFCKKKKTGRIISSMIEHSCVIKTLKNLESQGYEVCYLPVGLKGSIDPDDLKALITDNTILIALSAGNSETGVKNDIEALGSIAESKNIPLVIDAVAVFGKDPFSIPRGVLGVGFSGHKFHGPKGIGFCYVKSTSSLAPVLFGGDQEFGLRPGTESLPLIAGLSKAVELLKELPKFHMHMKTMRDYFEAALLSLAHPIEINGEGERVCNVSNLFFPNVDGETLLILLDRYGLCASHGSACSSGSLEPSTVLLGMGYSRHRSRGSIRFSFSRFTTKEEVDQGIHLISSILQNIRN